MKHKLKCWPEYFEAIVKGKKTFEVRENDRDFKVGDILMIREFKPCDYCSGSGRVWDNGDRTECGCSEPHGKYTGEIVEAKITYILNGGQFGIEENYVVMGIKKIK